MIRPRVLCCALALAALVPSVADAQSPSQRNPFSDLFGRAPQRTGREYTSIKFRSQAGAQMGWIVEDNLLAPGDVVPEGLSGGAQGSLVAEYMRDRVQISANGRYSYQEFRQEPAFGVPAFSTGVGVSFRPVTRLSFQGSGSFARSPFYQLIWLAAEPAATPFQPLDQAAILMMQNDTLEANAGVTSHYTSRSSLQVSGVVRQTDFKFSPGSDYTAVGGTIMWHRQMRRDLGLHAGYGREQLTSHSLTDKRVFSNERLDIGVDYGRSFAFARRTSLSFSTETSLLRENDGPRRFRLNGHVTLEHRFHRTWHAQVSAWRGTEFLPGFRTPVYTDHANAVLDGYLHKRLLLNMKVDAGQGQAGLSDPRKFISYQGSTKLTFGVSRHFGVFGQYAYFNYQMPPDPQTLFLVPRGARQAVALGVEMWAPIFDKDKVTRDPR